MHLNSDPTIESRFVAEEVTKLRTLPTMPILTDDPSLIRLDNTHYHADLAGVTTKINALKASLPSEGVLLCFNADELAAATVLLLEKEGIRFLPGGAATASCGLLAHQDGGLCHYS